MASVLGLGLCVLVDGEFFSLLECIDGAPRTTEQGGVMSWCGLPVCASGAFARTFLEPGTGFPMFERFPRPSLASSRSFLPRSFLLKCVAAVPAAAGLSSWTSNILSMSLSVKVCVRSSLYVCVRVCVYVCVMREKVCKNNNKSPGVFSCSLCIYETPPRGLSAALGHTQKPPCPFSRASYGEPGLRSPGH